MKSTLKISTKISFMLMFSISVISFGQTQIPVIYDNNNSNGDWKNQFRITFGASDVPSQGSRGLRIGNYDTDASINFHYSRWGNNASFNIFGGSEVGAPRYFHIGKYGQVASFSAKNLLLHDVTDFGLQVHSIALMAKTYGTTNDKTRNRWLLINPRLWTESVGNENAFKEGTYLNSRVLISDDFSDHTPEDLASDALLSVNGKIYCEGLKVQLSENWADYVFKPSYNLRPLSEVETFINKNGHLPNIPSAKEVEKEGLDVSDMQRLQMEKIEELTLYMIELSKKNEELQREVNLLKTKVSK